MATLWFEDPERGRYMMGEGMPEAVRRDGFAELIQTPYAMLECEEHVIVDGPRSDESLKLTALVNRKVGVSADELNSHWLGIHASNVGGALSATDGGLRYVISLASQGREDPQYAGMAELWYENAAASRAHADKIVDDGFQKLSEGARILPGREIVGVP